MVHGLIVLSVIVLLNCFRQMYVIHTLKESIKDKDAKYHSLLSYIESLKAASKPIKTQR